MKISIPSMYNICLMSLNIYIEITSTIFHTIFLKGHYSVVVEMTPIMCDSYILYKK